MADFPENLEHRVRRRVAHDLYKQLYADHTTTTLADNNNESREKAKRKSFWSTSNLSNFLWLLAAVVLLYYSDIVRVGFFDDRVQRTWFNIGLVFLLINISIASFLIIYLTFIKKVKTDDWELLYPAAIPLATVCFIFGATCMLVALWPIYNYFTPFLLFTLLMGFIVTVSWLP